MKSKIITGLIVLGVIIAGFMAYLSGNDGPSVKINRLDSFAQCLNEKQLTMYGAKWCSHCTREKALFSDSFQYVPYVECPDNTALCLEKGVEGYPTWIDVAGNKYAGEQGLEKLAEISACLLPVN